MAGDRKSSGAGELVGTVVASFVVPAAICIFYGAMYDLYLKTSMGLGADLVDLVSRDTVFNGATILFYAFYPVLWAIAGYFAASLAVGGIRRFRPTGRIAAPWLYRPEWPGLVALLFFVSFFWSRILVRVLQSSSVDWSVYGLVAMAMSLVGMAIVLHIAGNTLRLLLIVATALYLIAWTVIAEEMGTLQARTNTSFLVVRLSDDFPPRHRAIVAKYGDLLIAGAIQGSAVIPCYSFLKPEDPRILSMWLQNLAPPAVDSGGGGHPTDSAC
jgi:hypothetical protein